MSFDSNARFSFPISITENGVRTPNGTLGYDKSKTIGEHYNDFCKIGGARLVNIDKGNLALECGTQSGVIVIRVGANRGDFIPKFDPGSYGVEHTTLGSLLVNTKRIVDTKNDGKTTSVIFGIVPSQWPDGIHSCTLVQPDLQGRGAICLLGDGSSHPVEPTPGYRFYTPFLHHKGAGSGFVGRCEIYPLYHEGIMTLNRIQLSELLRAFNKDWTNGPVFARKNKIVQILDDVDQQQQLQKNKKTSRGRRSGRKKKKEGLDRWC